LKARGLHDPVLGITDCALGLIRAFEEVFPRSLRQRCLADRVRNLEQKVPQEGWRELKAQALAVYTAGEKELHALADAGVIVLPESPD
jgi:transposase-like protein